MPLWGFDLRGALTTLKIPDRLIMMKNHTGVEPEDVRLPTELFIQYFDLIHDGLKIGTVGFKIPINYLLVEELRKAFPKWIISVKEYSTTIKLSFRCRDNEISVEIIKHR